MHSAVAEDTGSKPWPPSYCSPWKQICSIRPLGGAGTEHLAFCLIYGASSQKGLTLHIRPGHQSPLESDSPEDQYANSQAASICQVPTMIQRRLLGAQVQY